MKSNTVKLFTIALIVFIVTDAIWLGFIAKNWYFEQYAQWLRLENGQLQPVWWATLIVYLLFATSVVTFVLPLAKGSLRHAALYGALLGGIIYGIYDFTCLAIFKDFPVVMGLIDWAWGIILCSWCSFITILIGNAKK